MKSYFINELRSFKIETTINKEQDCKINTEEATTLKNEIKLLDQLMNQKFIDTILQRSSKLSQNCDVSRIIPVANEAKKQPPERQHCEKKDTELYNQIKKMEVAKRKTDHQ